MSYIEYLDSILVSKEGGRIPFIHCICEYIWGNDGIYIFNHFVNDVGTIRDAENVIIQSAMRFRLSHYNMFLMKSHEVEKYIECMSFFKENTNRKYQLEFDEFDRIWYIMDYEKKEYKMNIVYEPKNNLINDNS